MKSLKIITVVFVLLSLLSCDDNDNKPAAMDIVNGQWSLVRVSGGLIGVNQAFEEGRIIWKFNSQQHTLVVINNNMDETLYDGLDSGTYNYNVVNDGDFQNCPESLSIDSNENYGCITLIDGKLIINDMAADGFLYEFRPGFVIY